MIMVMTVMIIKNIIYKDLERQNFSERKIAWPHKNLSLTVQKFE